jgi:hypothetical protein
MNITMKMDGSKKLFECTLDEVKQYLQVSAKDEEEILTTSEMAALLKCKKPNVQKYFRMGMPRVRKNAWKKNVCIDWVEKELPKILRTSRRNK